MEKNYYCVFYKRNDYFRILTNNMVGIDILAEIKDHDKRIPFPVDQLFGVIYTRHPNHLHFTPTKRCGKCPNIVLLAQMVVKYVDEKYLQFCEEYHVNPNIILLKNHWIKQYFNKRICHECKSYICSRCRRYFCKCRFSNCCTNRKNLQHLIQISAKF